MASCPQCKTRYADDVHECAADGATLVPDRVIEQLEKNEITPGTMIGEYRVRKKIGEGGFGAVFEAVQPVIGKPVAIKLLSRSFSDDPAIVSRFIAEARAVNQIRHKNIVDIFSFGALPDGRQYFVMELLSGEPLDERLRTKGHFELAEIAPILRGVLRALVAAHAAGLVHRDLKPENVFLAIDEDGVITPKLIDFGIAKLLGDERREHKTRTGTPIGTPYFMSPEQCRGKNVDHRTDIYSIGAMLHMLLTGRRPFDGDSAMDVLYKQMVDPPPRLSAHREGIPRPVEEFVLRMLEKDANARPQTMAEVLRQLDALAGTPERASIPILASGIGKGRESIADLESAKTSIGGPALSLAEAAPAEGGAGNTEIVSKVLPTAAKTVGDRAPLSAARSASPTSTGTRIAQVAGVAAAVFGVSLGVYLVVLRPPSSSSATASPSVASEAANTAKPGAGTHAPTREDVGRGSPRSTPGRCDDERDRERATAARDRERRAPVPRDDPLEHREACSLRCPPPDVQSERSVERMKLRSILLGSPLVLSAGLLASAGCDSIPELPANQCGNHVIERGEDCDGVGVGSNTCSAACRLTCAADRSCPAGWGCGVDGLCRQPTGELQDFGSSVALPGDALVLADFDGDGRRDVFARQDATFAVAYVDPAGLSPSVTHLSFDASDEFPDIPALGDVDGDGRTDLLLRLEDGISLMRGQPDRHLLPTPYLREPPANALPTDTLLSVDIDPRVDAPGDELVAIRDDGLYLLQDLATPSAGPVKMFSLDPGKKHYVTPGLHYQNLNVQGLQLLVVDEGGTTVTLFEPFTMTIDPMTGFSTPTPNFEDSAQFPPVTMTLPAGVTAAGPAQVAHMSLSFSESNPDILVPGSDGDMYVLFRIINARQFGSTPNTADNTARHLIRSLDGVELHELPLITGLFSQDGSTDFVDPDGIHVNVCVAGNCGVKFPTVATDPITLDLTTWAVPDGAEGWSGAKVTAPSVNGVDFGSIVAWSSKAGFTYFRRTNSYFAPFKFSTRGPISNVDFGDLNGDGAVDLVYTQRSSRAAEGDTQLQSLNVSFGDALSLPTEAVDFGDVGALDVLFHARLPDPTRLPDAIDDIYARDATTHEYYVFRGSTDRAIQSPLELPIVCSGASLPKGVARVPSLGRFRAGGAMEAAILFQTEDAAGFHWNLWSYDPASNETEAACTSLVGPLELPSPGSDELRTLAADLDRDGTDELLILPVGASSLFVADRADSGWVLSTITLDGPHTNLSLLDPTNPSSDVLLRSATGLTVLWNDGTLAPKPSAPLALTGTPCPERSADAVFGESRGVTAIRLDPSADAGKALLAVSEEDTLLLSLDTKARSVAVDGCITDQLGGGGSAVTSGDVTGDGVEDLVVSRASGTRIFAGVPVVK
ncbi:MAG: protein kinase [Polyangiaceae bacterium]